MAEGSLSRVSPAQSVSSAAGSGRALPGARPNTVSVSALHHPAGGGHSFSSKMMLSHPQKARKLASSSGFACPAAHAVLPLSSSASVGPA